MKKNTTKSTTNNNATKSEDLFKRLAEEGWTYIKTVVDVVREPVVVLNKELKIIAANESFYEVFKVKPKDTENKIIYRIGNGQWNIPVLRKLLEGILTEGTFFKGFEVTHEFPVIGRKVMILNARQIHFKGKAATNFFPEIILLAIEDVTEMMIVAETLAKHAKQLEAKLFERTQKLETEFGKLEEAFEKLKRKP